MEVKFKKLSDSAITPTRSYETDAGLDLYAAADAGGDQYTGGVVIYHTGLAIAIPEGFVGLIFPRSSICNKGLSLTNCVGVVDSGYTGEVLFKFRVQGYDFRWYKKGDRIGQLIVMPFPKVTLIEVENLDAKPRGDGGFGSTGA